MCWLSFLTSPFLRAPLPNWTWHASQLKSMASRSLPRIFYPSIIRPPPPLLRQMPIGFYRQVALDFPAWFDFYGKFLGLTFTFKFSAKVSEYFTRRPPPGAGTLYSILAGSIQIFLQSNGRTKSDIFNDNDLQCHIV